jgi:chemotaxis family two-component system sensor kinase Cph1
VGLRFSASGMPRQARALCHRNWLRLIPDADYTPVPLVSRAEGPLDLSLSELCSASPVHLAYLRNIDVGASLSISIPGGLRR